MRNKRINIIMALCVILCILFLFIPLQVFGRTLTATRIIPFGRFKITAYCPCCDCSNNYNYETATGATAKEGRTIAVDPDVIPYGSQVLIGDHMYIAEDCGAKVKGDVVDIFFDDHDSVEWYGVKHCDIFVVEGYWEQ